MSEEFVSGSYRQRAYSRRRPYTRERPTEAMRKARALFAKAAREHGRDSFGVVTVIKDGIVKDMPASAATVASILRGTRVAPERPAPAPTPLSQKVEEVRRAIERLRELQRLYPL